MSQNTLIEKIKADAKAEAEKIKAEGRARVEIIQRETEEEINARKEVFRAELEKELKQRELVALAKARQEAKIAVQEEKRRQIDQLFGELEDELAGQSEKEYVTYFASVAKEVIPEEVKPKRVIAPEKRKDETSEILDKLGIKAEVKTDPNLKAGFVLEADDGVYDVTLDRLLSDRRAKLEMEIFKQVMG